MTYDDLAANIEKLIDEAISADMWRRCGFYPNDAGGFVRPALGGGPTEAIPDRHHGATGDVPRFVGGDPADTINPSNDCYAFWEREIPPIFEEWLDLPDPRGFQPAIDSMHDAMAKLAQGDRDEGTYQNNPDLTFVDTVGDHFTNFQGSFAVTFKANYADKLPNVLSGQWYVARILRHTLVAEQKVWSDARTDIGDLCARAVTAMHDSRHGGVDWTNAIKVAGAIASVAGLIPGPHRAVIDVVNKVRGGVAVAVEAREVLGAFDSPGTEIDHGLDSASPLAVLDDLRDEVTAINKAITSQEDDIAGKLDDVLGLMLDTRDTFDLEEPRIVDATEPGQVFGELQVNPVIVRKCGTSWYPPVASALWAAYAEATPESKFIPFDRPAGIGRPGGGPRAEYQAAALRLANNLRDTSWEVQAVADILVICANDLDGTEQDVVAALTERRKDAERLQQEYRLRTW